MHHWFRVYNTLVDDPKVQQLSSALFKALINLWCLASQNGGALPAVNVVAYKLRMTPRKAADIIARLVTAGLLDDSGGVVMPHNWNGRQFQSDCSTERVRRFRANRRAAQATIVAAVPEIAEGAAAPDAAAPRGAASPLEAELRDEVARAFVQANAASVPDTGRVRLWLSQGYEADIILAVVSEIVARKPNLSSLNYFDAPIREAHASRAPKRLALGPPSRLGIEEAVRLFATTRHWSRWAGPAPGLAGCRASTELLARFGLAPDGAPFAPSADLSPDPSTLKESLQP
ncbi:hypothetical protein [Bradyrhizobium sp. 2TAF24]|uniref:hypothetical protein n=1 Tax=Bradyrhizobium sp. 2TAF24 TaxID=3233011 RepID=UPI003F93F649